LPKQSRPDVDLPWFETVPAAITVCDKRYAILYMNARSAEVNKEAGGKSLIGENLLDCHNPESQRKLREIMATGKPNVYTVEKKGVKKMVYQCPWRKNGKLAGLVEIYFVLPRNLPNRVRT
jgi:transcriptional regulator with PAS, ATPase and Fis domain